MSCCDDLGNNCEVIQIDTNTAQLVITIGSGIGCGCKVTCTCSTALNSGNTWINIRRDGPVYRHNSFGCCGNPAHRVNNCPILPGDLSYPFPTYIVPCPDPVAPPFPPVNAGIFYKYPPFVQYPLFTRKGNALTFYLDDYLYNAPKGRYVADLFVNEAHCSHVKLNLNKSCRVLQAKAVQFTQSPCTDMNPSPDCNNC